MPYVWRDGAQIYYETHGATGSWLLMAPGLGMELKHWADTLRDFTTRHRAITFQPRGALPSEAPAGPYTMRDLAEDGRAVLDAVGVARAHVYGVSMGGHLAQELALNHPERVAGLVLALTCDHTPPSGRERLLLWRELRRLDPSLYWRAVAYMIFGDEFFENGTQAEAALEDAVRDLSRWEQHGWDGCLAACLDFDVRGRLHELRCPTLVIGGMRDLVFPPWVSEAHAARIPGARHAAVDAAHVVMGLAAQRLNALTLDFLASVDA
jgi:pimeloyl-ACP methyl ester carboxylesterase